ncbi:hypothetical protein H5984_10540, partial [Ligilactobacillus salivarius]
EMANGPEKIKENFDKVKTIDDGVTALNQKDTANFKIGKFIGGGASGSVSLNGVGQGMHIVGLWDQMSDSSWPKSLQNRKSFWGSLIQCGDESGNIATQILILANLGSIYFRSYVDHTWKEWTRIDGQRDQ